MYVCTCAYTHIHTHTCTYARMYICARTTALGAKDTQWLAKAHVQRRQHDEPELREAGANQEARLEVATIGPNRTSDASASGGRSKRLGYAARLE